MGKNSSADKFLYLPIISQLDIQNYIYCIELQMKKNIFCLLAALLLVVTLQQNFAGGYVPHFYTGIQTIDEATFIPAPFKDYVHTLTRPGTFSTSEDIHKATALFDFTYTKRDTLAITGTAYVHFTVQSMTMSDNRNQVTIRVNSQAAPVAGAIVNRYSFKRATLSIILIGEQMPGSFDTIPSTYLYAANSQVKTVLNPTKFSFQPSPPSTAPSSPFNYDWVTTPTTPYGCGAVKRGTRWLIQYSTTNCDQVRATLFITGIEMIVPSSSAATAADKLKLTKQQINLKDVADATFSASLPSAGITVPTDSLNVNKFQVSMIVTAIREYSSTNYPLQGILIDTYKMNSYITTSQVVATSWGATPPATTAVPFQTTTATDVYSPDKNGHSFYGLSSIYEQITAAALPQNPVGFSTKIDLVAKTFTPTLNPATSNDLDLTASNFKFDYNTLLFTNNANPCNEDSRLIVAQNTVSTATTGVTVTNAAGTSTYASASNDPYLLTGVTLIANQKFTTGGTATHTITFAPSEIVPGVYEGVLFIPTTTNSAGSTLYRNLKITAFGQQIYNVRQAVEATGGKFLYHFAFQVSNPVGNKIVITYQVQDTTPASVFNLDQTVQFVLYRQRNVIDINGNCANSCVASSANVNVAVDYSTVPPTCVECSRSLNQVYNQANRACDCALGYFRNTSSTATTLICESCTVALCGVCPSTTTCNQCVANAVFINAANTNLGCTCVTGYYASGPQCLACSPGCVTCTTTSTNCGTCVANDNTRRPPAQGCICRDGYFDNGVPICVACAPVCRTCSGSALTCTGCFGTATVQTGTNTCGCTEGYYFGLVESQGVCLKCSMYCKTCANDAATCVTCKTSQWVLQGTTCRCNGTLRLIQYANSTLDAICVDPTCTTIDPNCIGCSLLLSTGTKICQQCNTAGGWQLAANNLSCICRQNTFLNGTTCSPCGVGCSVCASPTSCTTCAMGANPSGPGTCKCNLGFYLGTAGTTYACLPCNQNCANCTSLTVCNNCTNGFTTTSSGLCICEGSRFVSADGMNCVGCMTGCQSCTNATVCVTCLTNYLKLNGACTLNCPTGFYNRNNVECQRCDTACRSCSSLLRCNQCMNGYYLFLNKCISSCPAGFFTTLGGNQCFVCSPTCLTCSLNPNNCTNCSSTLVLYNNQCISGCPAGNFYNGTACVACSAPCLNCSGAANSCTSCPANQYLWNNTCSAQCPTNFFNGVCLGICPEGTYLNGTVCTNCPTNCRTCLNSTYCTACRGTSLSYRGSCINAPCPANTLLSAGACLDCDSSCINCSGNVASCIQCRPGFYRMLDKCYASCPSGSYPDISNPTAFVCRTCDASCRTCTGPGQCSLCLNGSLPTNGVCEVACGANCLICTGSTCSQCATGYYQVDSTCQSFCPAGANPVNGACVCLNGILHMNNCVPSCPGGFVNISSQCRTCASPCRTCSGTIDNCTACLDGYSYDNVNRKCVQRSNCPTGQYYSTFGDCRFICEAGQFYYNLACYSGICPPGYIPNSQQRVCTRQVPTSGCEVPKYLQGSSCVFTCSVGFYPDDTNRVCTCCPSNCYACSSSTNCSSCAPGFTIQGTICVPINDNCPAGQFRFNNICCSVCPAGTFAQNGFCVRLCAAGLYYWNSGCYATCPFNLSTPDACVTNCPVGYNKDGNQCVPATMSCNAGQFWNQATGFCENCRFPCASCAGMSSFCTNCAPSFSLTNGTCYSETSCPAGTYPSQSGCQRCNTKCRTCTDFNVCSACATGYYNTGADCVPDSLNLQAVTLQIVSIVRQQLVIFIKISANFLPNGLPTNLASQILIFIPTIPNPCSQVNMWVADGFIFVALTHTSYIPTYNAMFLLNSGVFDTIYRSMGCSTANSYCETSVHPNLSPAPTYMTIPSYSFNSRTYNNPSQLKKVLNVNLKLELLKSLNINRESIN